MEQFLLRLAGDRRAAAGDPAGLAGRRQLLPRCRQPTGAWGGQANKLAAYTSGGWRFVAPFDGLAAVVRSSGSTAVYRNGVWEVGKLRGSEVAVDGVKVVGAQQAAIPAPAGGTTADVEARAAIGAILAALRSHGLILS